MEKLKQNPIVKKLGLNRILLVCILILMFVVFKVVLGSKFPVGDSIKSTLNYVYFLGLPVTWCYIRNCNRRNRFLHRTGNVLLCTRFRLLHDKLHSVPCAAAMVICVLIGLAFGIFNGWLVSYLSVPPFIVSMASMNIAKGIASVFTKTQSVSWPLASDPTNGWFRNIVSYKGFPVGLVIFLGAAIICGIILYNTKPGRYILCLGSNTEAVRLSGVDTKKWNMLAYVICGVLSWNWSTVFRSYIYNRSAWLWRSVQQRSNRWLCNGWYIHGWWTCFHRRYCNRCIYYLSSAAGNHGIWSW